MLRLKLEVAYTGTRYNGWQAQNVASHCTYHPKGQPTIQAEVEKALAVVAKIPIKVYGSGRTDSGVHAEAQVAHCDIPQRLSKVNWQRALNISLPPDIRIRSYELVPETFHARFSAVSKIYTYRLWCNREFTPPRLAPFVWSPGPLALEPMLEAAQLLTGTHNFAAFQNMGTTTVRNTERTISSITCTKSVPDPFYVTDSSINNNFTSSITTDEPLADIARNNSQWPELLWQIEANGFLKQMVRNIMGLLVWIGREKLEVADVTYFLQANQRTALGSKAPTAPANGLTLTKVLY